ncbi:hypothetical protein V6N11_043898 [Hibiscus sabdariffa]|uniref:Uncharacterized protein n=1 Tax=Hibiscus sabdariffa TaxID=183260 RepID=A0ABR2RDM7_9ROSI
MLILSKDKESLRESTDSDEAGLCITGDVDSIDSNQTRLFQSVQGIFNRSFQFMLSHKVQGNYFNPVHGMHSDLVQYSNTVGLNSRPVRCGILI